MLRNRDTGDYYCSYKRNKNKKWTSQHKASIWNRKSDIIKSIKVNHLHEVDIVEFELIELKTEGIRNNDSYRVV